MKKEKDAGELRIGCGPSVTSSEMKEIERKADEAGLSYYQMMENAGTGAAEFINSRESVRGKSILILCGKGNNGGDGFVAARKLTEMGASVKLILAEGEPKTEDAAKNRAICRARNIPVTGLKESEAPNTNTKAEAEAEAERLFHLANIIIDAIYGTGFRSVLREQVRELTRMINQSEAAVYALDIPSGQNGDTGEADEDTVRADCTIVFHRQKTAHTYENSHIYCGEIVCISIGIEEVIPQ